MVRRFLLIFLLCASGSARAEPAVGGKAGLNFANIMRDPPSPDVKRTYRYGLTAGASLQLLYLEPVYPQMEILFTNRGTDAKIDGQTAGLFELNYIDLVFLARIRHSMDAVTLYGLAGPELSVLLTATVTSALGATNDIRNDLRGIDVGVLVGAGVALGPFSWGTLTFEARYDRGLINIDTVNEGVTAHNQSIAFLIGYEYRRDRDRDGIPDGKDRCPDDPEDRDGFEDSDGCPDPDDEHGRVAR
jgi:hypothetical protein